MRTFDTGATRDTDTGKPDFEGFLSPYVIQAYGEYMQQHRTQADGSLRDSDNWQKEYGENHLAVCMKSAWRHFIDTWREHRGLQSRDGIDAAICGLLFNIMAYYHKILKDRLHNPQSVTDCHQPSTARPLGRME